MAESILITLNTLMQDRTKPISQYFAIFFIKSRTKTNRQKIQRLNSTFKLGDGERNSMVKLLGKLFGKKEVAYCIIHFILNYSPGGAKKLQL